MEPILNFTDHPSLKGTATETIYFLNGCFYWATRERLTSVIIESIGYTNMGEPYRELAAAHFVTYPAMNKYSVAPKPEQQSVTRHDSIDIEIEDAARLFRYCQSIGYKLDVSAELKGNRGFVREVSK